MREKLDKIERITLQNNEMLKSIINWINYYSQHLEQDNMGDFGRNVFANLLSNYLDGNTNNNRRI